MDVDVDTEDFIAEIEQFPDIWDTSSNDYGNNVIKKNSWEQVILKFCPDFGDKPTVEKTTTVIFFTIQRRKLLLLKSIANLMRVYFGSSCAGRLKYIYFNANLLRTDRTSVYSQLLYMTIEHISTYVWYTAKIAKKLYFLIGMCHFLWS
ncbi:hypothetical protein RI129_010102 [Pyrocoelia pectoralis]|uniref:MADF domain-containing protein n=1 Tax=Pyrocoelia pectoralis TaxID=417401 RepID=A0AAN7ZCY0_9COLE